MDTLVTIIQILLGFLFTVGGLVKLALPYATYSNLSAVAWAKEFKPAHIRLLGIFEASGGLSLIVGLFWPALTFLTPIAAVGIALYMSGAMATHLRRSEYASMLGNLVVFLVPALFLAYARLVGFTV